MGVALDEPTGDDTLFPMDGFNVIVEKSVLKSIQGINIQFLPNKWIGSEIRVTPL